MGNEFDIKKFRMEWKSKNKDCLNRSDEVKKGIANSLSITSKYFAELNFFDVLLAKTNDMTTQDELVNLLDDMIDHPTIPKNILDESFYLEQWNSRIRLLRNRIDRR